MQMVVRLLCCAGVILGGSFIRAEDVEALRIVPSQVLIGEPETSEQLLVWGTLGKRERDRTTEVVYTSNPSGIVLISSSGQVTPLRDGHADITVTRGAQSASVPVDVTGLTHPVPVSFRRDVLPILSKCGCNSGGSYRWRNVFIRKNNCDCRSLRSRMHCTSSPTSRCCCRTAAADGCSRATAR